MGTCPSPVSLQVHITVFPMSSNNSCNQQHCRPISLLNVDMKLLGTFLGFKINGYVCSLIQRDQVGFVPGQQAGDNIHKGIHLTHFLHQCKFQAFSLPVTFKKHLSPSLGITYNMSCRIGVLGNQNSHGYLPYNLPLLLW